MTRNAQFINSPRMQDIDVLPLFHKLRGQKIVVAGIGEAAFWKAELVAATGAKVEFYCGNSDLSQTQIENLQYIDREWQENDLENARIAILQSQNDEEAQNFINAARKFGAAVNIIDRPEFCDFQFGAIVNRSPLVIGVSTDGASPALGQQIRARLEAMFPPAITKWLKAAQNLRPIIKKRELDFGTRRNFWHNFAKQALENPNSKPDEAHLIAQIDHAQPIRGEVILMGAGPGDAELLTLKAVRALGRADVIMYDDLVTKEVLDFARREAQLINVGKRGGKPSVAQQEINQMLVDFALSDKVVVRVKGGDALIFGRLTEELEACRNAGIKFEIIPGISSPQGAAAALGFSLTDRQYAKRVQFVTAHSAKGDLPDDINWGAIAAHDTTTIVFMPRATIGAFVKKALENGMQKDFPAAIISNATRENQAIIECNFEDLPQTFSMTSPNGPEMVIIGRVLNNLRKEN